MLKKITATVTVCYEVEDDVYATGVEIYAKDGTTIEEELKATLIENVKNAFSEEDGVHVNVSATCIVE